MRVSRLMGTGKALVAASHWIWQLWRYHGQIKLWDPSSGQERATLKGDPSAPSRRRTCPDVGVGPLTEVFGQRPSLV
jgi:hypothetical protein